MNPAYLQLYEQLNPQLIANCAAVVTDDIHFTDPFNDLHGISAFQSILAKTLSDVSNPRFTILDRATSETCDYVRWQFSGEVRFLGQWQVTGMSEIYSRADGRVYRHIDHWDAGEQFYAKLPVLGWLINLVRRRLQV